MISFKGCCSCHGQSFNLHIIHVSGPINYNDAKGKMENLQKAKDTHKYRAPILISWKKWQINETWAEKKGRNEREMGWEGCPQKIHRKIRSTSLLLKMGFRLQNGLKKPFDFHNFFFCQVSKKSKETMEM